MKGPLVFISHAKPDKPRLKPLVDTLIAAGFRVFVDSPIDMGYSAAQVDDMMERLQAGVSGGWPNGLKEQIRTCDCLLLCWSKAGAAGRDGLKREIDQADYDNKLLVCRIDQCEVEGIGGGIDDQQAPKIYSTSGPGFDPDRMELLIRDIRRFIDGTKATIEQKRRRDMGLLPLLAGRQGQQSALREALMQAKTSGGVRPVVLAGPNNELPAEFVERFCRTAGLALPGNAVWPTDGSSPRPEDIARVDVVWPGANTSFADAYRQQLCAAVAPSSDFSEDAAAKALAELGRPVVVYQEIYAEAWRRDEPERLFTWVRFWTRIAQKKPVMQVIPIVALRLPSADPGWRDFPPPGLMGMWLRTKARKLWQTMDALKQRCAREPETQTASILALDLLQPISGSDRTAWLNAVIPRLERESGNLSIAVRRGVNKLYDGPPPNEKGVNHQRFRDVVDKELFG